MDIRDYHQKNSFRLEDFAGLDDRTFLRAAYAAILKRDPDHGSRLHYLDLLNKKKISRVQVLGHLRYSNEGRRQKTTVHGLLRPFAVHTALDLPARLIRIIRNRFALLQDRFVSWIARELTQKHAVDIRELVDQPYPENVYLALENEFRGSPDELEKGFRVYLPMLREVHPLEGQIVDLGCGRGEWLEFLRRHGIGARGVDISQTMLDTCARQGLDVVHRDALAYLMEQDDDSLSAVTAFQLMEHLPPVVLVRIWEEAFRTLMPGGLVLFETPNPENVQVSSYYFHLDPTHKKPVPPPLATYTLDALGFKDIKIIRNREFERPIFEDPRLNRFFCAAMDYAVLAYKPEAGITP